VRATRADKSFAYHFWSGRLHFRVGRRVAKGASGVVYHGTFGNQAVALKVNNPRRVKLRTDADEVRMQSLLYCHLRDGRTPIDGPCARVPKTFFAVRASGVGRMLGMARVDRSLLAHVQRVRTAALQIAVLRDALRRVATLLGVLQRDLKFMHGDLHAENVMVRDVPFDVLLIDFGMASLTPKRDAPASRFVTDARYADVRFHAHLDLLTLLTALREDLALSGHAEAARWCGSFVEPFWDAVRRGLFAGKPRGALRFGSQATVRSARRELEANGEIYYAHHLLYEHIGGVSYPRCSPAGFLKALTAAWDVVPDDGHDERIFADV
jgi:hypothetical protein